MIKKVFACAFLTAALFGNAPAHASIVQWNLSNVMGDGGLEAVTGFFDYDTVNQAITNFNIAATNPPSLFTPTIDPYFSVSGGTVNFNGPGIELTLVSGNPSNSVYNRTDNIDLAADSIIFSPRNVYSLTGELKFAGEVSTVPLPATGVLFIAAIMGLFVVGYHRRKALREG